MKATISNSHHSLQKKTLQTKTIWFSDEKLQVKKIVHRMAGDTGKLSNLTNYLPFIAPLNALLCYRLQSCFVTNTVARRLCLAGLRQCLIAAPNHDKSVVVLLGEL